MVYVTEEPRPALTFEPESVCARAIEWAAELFAGDCRKGKPTVPYLSHLLSVAALVMSDGGSEAEVAAALLHDAMEDKHVSEQDIADKLGGSVGKHVARIVFGCSDGIDRDGRYVDERGKPVAERGPSTWRDRKCRYLAHLKDEEDLAVLRVSAADKLDNARDLVADLQNTKSNALREFNSPPEQQLWWSTSLADAFQRKPHASSLTKRLVTAVDEIKELVDLPVATEAWEMRQAEKAAQTAP